tara:strand:- start:6060 stop:8015 length:1956 start_codon:yes stop_codon:yes gene_type:complete
MDLETFEQKTKDGTLTIGDAFEYAYGREDVKSIQSRQDRLNQLRSAIDSDRIPSASLDSPYFETVKSPAFIKDLSEKGTTTANYFGGMQALEKELNAGFSTFDFEYTSIAGRSGKGKKAGFGGGQSRGARPMEGPINSKDLDKAYADGFAAMGDSVDADTKAFIFFHKNTVVRVETMLGTKNKDPLTLDDLIISENPDTGNLTVAVKGVKRENKKRNPVTYEGAMAEFLANQAAKSKAAAAEGEPLTKIKLFNTTKSRVDKAHNTYIKPIVEERFPTAIPKDKNGVSGWQPTDIRSAVQDQLAREFKVDPALREDYVGHQQPGTAGKAYLAASADGRELGQLTEALLAQNAKNLNLPNVNMLITDTVGLDVPNLAGEGGVAFPAATEDLRGQPVSAAARELTEAEQAEIEQASRTRATLQKEQELQALSRIEQMPPIDEDTLRKNLEISAEKAEVKKKFRDEKKAEKAAKASGSFDGILDDVMDIFGKDTSKLESSMLSAAVAAKGLAEIIPGPAVDLATAFLDPESFDIAEQKGRQTARNLFGPSPTIEAVGGTAGVAGEMLTGAVADPKGAEQSAKTVGAFAVSPLLGMMQQSLGKSKPGPEPQIQAPPPTQGTSLEAQQATGMVNQARRAAMQGEETSMTGSFLQPPI